MKNSDGKINLRVGQKEFVNLSKYEFLKFLRANKKSENETKKGKWQNMRGNLRGVNNKQYSGNSRERKEIAKNYLDRNNTDFALQLLEVFRKHSPFNIGPNDNGDKASYSFLKYYQNLTRFYITKQEVIDRANDCKTRGLLCIYEMGMGKSLLAISIAIDMLRVRQPIVLLAKSLQGNMENAIRQYVKLRKQAEPDYPIGRLTDEQLDKWIDDNFSFVSMNASNMISQMRRAADPTLKWQKQLEGKIDEVLKLISLDNRLLIIDEAHNFFRAITNGSKNAIGLYEMIMRSKNLVLIFLSGTPIVNDPFEIVPCFSMISGNENLFPTDYVEFRNLFIGEEKVNKSDFDDGETIPKIKNRAHFQNRLFGLVSYVDHNSSPGAEFGADTLNTIEVNFPRELPIIVELVNMDPRQYTFYQLAREKEKEEGGFQKGGAIPALIKPKGKSASTYRVRSRQISNYCPPDYELTTGGIKSDSNTKEKYNESEGENKIAATYSPKFERALNNINKHPKQIGLFYSQFTGAGGIASFRQFLLVRGWEELSVTAEHFLGAYDEGEEDWSPNIPTAQSIVGKLDTEYYLRDKLGIEPFQYEELSDVASDLEDNIWKTGAHSDEGEQKNSDMPQNIPQNIPPTFAIISGETSIEQRIKIQQIVNSSANSHGELISLLIISATGAEGLDLKGVRHVHCLEPYWNLSRILQVIARAVRNDSLAHLPENEQTVQPYIYLAVPPDTEKLKDGSYPPTTDTELYSESIRNQILIDSFMDAIREVSIECLANKGKNCRVCNPDNKQLFSRDILTDLAAADPCHCVKTKKINAKEIEYNGKKYFYDKNPASIYGYSIYFYDPDFDVYKLLPEINNDYPFIVDSIVALNSAASVVPE